MVAIQTPQKKLRQGSYCLIIDPQAKKIIVEDNGGIPGGGIESWEAAIQACIREVAEETNNQIIINPDKLHFFKELIFETRRTPEFDWDGKEMQLFVYCIKQSEFIDFDYFNTEYSQNIKMSWMAFDQFFIINKRLQRSELEKFITQLQP